MKYLSQGLESAEKVELLLQLTNIRSENIQMALVDHLVKNFSISDAAVINSCRQPNLTEALSSLNKVAEKVEKINEIKHH